MFKRKYSSSSLKSGTRGGKRRRTTRRRKGLSYSRKVPQSHDIVVAGKIRGRKSKPVSKAFKTKLFKTLFTPYTMDFQNDYVFAFGANQKQYRFIVWNQSWERYHLLNRAQSVAGYSTQQYDQTVSGTAQSDFRSAIPLDEALRHQYGGVKQIQTLAQLKLQFSNQCSAGLKFTFYECKPRRDIPLDFYYGGELPFTLENAVSVTNFDLAERNFNMKMCEGWKETNLPSAAQLWTAYNGLAARTYRVGSSPGVDLGFTRPENTIFGNSLLTTWFGIKKVKTFHLDPGATNTLTYTDNTKKSINTDVMMDLTTSVHTLRVLGERSTFKCLLMEIEGTQIVKKDTTTEYGLNAGKYSWLKKVRYAAQPNPIVTKTHDVPIDGLTVFTAAETTYINEEKDDIEAFEEN